MVSYSDMPRTASMGSSIEKTLKYMRKVQQSGEVSLKFTNYTSKNCIIYKLNKYHYLDSELYVIDMQALREMARLFSKPNNVELVHLGTPPATQTSATSPTRRPSSSRRATGTTCASSR